MFGVLYNDSNFNLALPSIVSSNTNGTPLQLAFPTSTTGTSIGHYTYYGIEGASGSIATKGCSEHLNLSGILEGGHNFWHSNSTGLPQLILSVTRNYLNLDTLLKNTSDNVNLDMAENTLTIKGLLNNDLTSSSTLNWNTLSVRNLDTSDNSRVQPDNIAVGNDITNHFSTINSECFSVTDTINTSTLTNTRLLFNNVPQVKNIIYQHYSPYFNNGAHDAINIPSNITDVYPFFGWYFKNVGANDYINWMIPPDNSMIVKDIYGIYLQFFNISAESQLNVVITTPTSSCTFNLTNLASNTYYTAFINISGKCPPPQYYASVLKNVTTYTTTGTYLPNQPVSSMNIITSTTIVNNNQFIITKFGVITINGTQEWMLIS